MCINIEAQNLRPDKFLFRVFMNHSPPTLQLQKEQIPDIWSDNKDISLHF